MVNFAPRLFSKFPKRKRRHTEMKQPQKEHEQPILRDLEYTPLTIVIACLFKHFFPEGTVGEYLEEKKDIGKVIGQLMGFALRIGQGETRDLRQVFPDVQAGLMFLTEVYPEGEVS